MYRLFINKDELLSNEHELVGLLFNEEANNDLISFYKALCNKIGGSYNCVVYLFWDSLDDYDKFHTPKYEGIEVSTEFDDESIIISNEDLLYYMKLVAGKSDNKQDELNKYIDEFTKLNNLK